MSDERALHDDSMGQDWVGGVAGPGMGPVRHWLRDQLGLPAGPDIAPEALSDYFHALKAENDRNSADVERELNTERERREKLAQLGARVVEILLEIEVARLHLVPVGAIEGHSAHQLERIALRAFELGLLDEAKGGA